VTKRLRTALLAGGAGLLLVGCGQAVVLPHPAEQIISRFVYGRTGFRPPDVHCPSGVPAKAGRSFTCRFTGPDGKYVAIMRITSVHGSRVLYDVRTQIVERAVLVRPAEREVTDFVFAHTHFRPTDVTCPSGVLAHVGVRYQCHFTGPDGTYTAYVQITGINGASATDNIVTRRTGP
jgi:hypothetical protein